MRLCYNPATMKAALRKVLIVAAVGVLLTISALILWSARFTYRTTYIPNNGGALHTYRSALVRVNRITGRADVLTNSGWKQLRPSPTIDDLLARQRP